MSTVIISPEYNVTIPEDVRIQAGIQPGQQFEVFQIGGVIELAPVKNIQSMRGSLPGLVSLVERVDREVR